MPFDEQQAHAGTTIDLGRMTAAVVGARRRIAFAGLLAGTLGLAAALAWPPASVVEMRLLVEPHVAATATGEGAAVRDDRIVAAEIGLIGSTEFLDRVAAADVAADPVAAPDVRAAAEARAARLRERLVVDRAERSRILVLSMADADPTAARGLLGTLSHELAALHAETRARSEAEIEHRFAGDLDVARRRLIEARAAAAGLEAERAAEAGDPGARGGDEAERREAAAVLDRLERLAASGDAEKAVDLAATPALQRLRERRAALRARLAELSVVYLENHPLVKEAHEQMADLRREMRAELPRAVAARRTMVAELDRRIAERAAETTAAIPDRAAPDLAGAERAFTDLQNRRRIALETAFGEAAAAARVLSGPEVVSRPSPARPLLGTLFAALAGAVAATVLIARRAGRGAAAAAPAFAEPVFETFSSASAAAPVFVEPAPAVAFAAQTVPETATVPPVAPAVAEADPFVDPDFEVRAEDYEIAAERLIAAVRREIDAECGEGRRIVVVSTSDGARSLGAARALARAIVEVEGTAGLVEELALADLLDGRVAFSEAIRRDRATGAWIVEGGRRPTDDVLAEDTTESILEALEISWGALVIDAGRLVRGAGLARLLADADAVILAEDATDDACAVAAFDGLIAAGKSVWLLDVDVERAALDWADAA